MIYDPKEIKLLIDGKEVTIVQLHVDWETSKMKKVCDEYHDCDIGISDEITDDPEIK